MTPDELRAIMSYLRKRVQLDTTTNDNSVVITFRAPTEDEMVKAGLNPAGVKQVRNASWWSEMVTDIIETPEFCEPDELAQQILEYARDAVSDYLRKRIALESGQ